MDKLTDSEIVKALKELCDNAFKKIENPIKRKEKIKIWDILCKSLDLINRLQNEKDTLNKKLTDAYLMIDKLKGD
jgi:hypothetical protein